MNNSPEAMDNRPIEMPQQFEECNTTSTKCTIFNKINHSSLSGAIFHEIVEKLPQGGIVVHLEAASVVTIKDSDDFDLFFFYISGKIKTKTVIRLNSSRNRFFSNRKTQFFSTHTARLFALKSNFSKKSELSE